MYKVIAKNSTYILFGIILVGLLLRTIYLGDVPAGFHSDEAAYGYNAYSILKTGMDEYGERFPLALKSFGEYKPALYAYITIPFIALFDLSPFAVRLPSAIFGVATILALYLYVNRLFDNKKIALVSSFILAILPWHINLSRTTSEVIVSTFFIILMLFFLEGFKKKSNLQNTFLVCFFAFMGIISYTASLFFVPLIVIISILTTFLVADRRGFIKQKKLYLLLAIVLSLVAMYGLILSTSRFSQVNIFSNPETKLNLEEQIRESEGVNVLVTRAMHNKFVNYGRTIIENQFEYLSLDYLFFSGGYPMRQRIPDAGLFYLWQLPFLFAGLLILFKEKKEIAYYLLAWWIVLLIPSALTFDEIPNVYRSLITLFPIVILISVALVKFFEVRRNRIFMAVLVSSLFLVAAWEFAYYINQYYIHQEKHQPWYRGYAYQELAEFIGKEGENYEKITITKAHHSPYIYLLFFNKYDPVKYIKEGSPRDLGHDKGFLNFLFSDYDCPLSAGKDGTDKFTGDINYIYVNRGDCVDPVKNIEKVKIINWQDGTPAFRLLRYIGPEQTLQ